MNSAAVKLAPTEDRRYGKRQPLVYGAIRKDVPQPSRSRVTNSTMPFGDMDVGDSFHVSGIAKSTIARLAKQYDAKFKVGPDPEGEGEFRVWRTA